MGISDKDYGDALIQHKAYLAQQTKEKEMIRTGTLSPDGTNSIYPANVTTTTATLSGHAATGTIWASPPSFGIKTINEQDLQHDAMKAPLSALIDMWTMRFQGEWVSESEFTEDDFWRLALIRLVGANKLEKHNLASSYAPVYRIIE